MKWALNKQQKEVSKLPNSNKYKFIFSKNWFENDKFEYRRVQAREALKMTIVFIVGFIMAFCAFAFHGG